MLQAGSQAGGPRRAAEQEDERARPAARRASEWLGGSPAQLFVHGFGCPRAPTAAATRAFLHGMVRGGDCALSTSNSSTGRQAAGSERRAVGFSSMTRAFTHVKVT
jgi:hypothetical protein